MFGHYDYKSMLSPEELLEYLRKSRSDDPMMSVEEVLQKHETILDEWSTQQFGETIPEENKYREVVSGESIEDRIAFQMLLKKIESPKIKAVLVVEIQRLGRPDLEEIGRITKIFRYTNTMVITPQRAYDLQDEYDRDAFERELKRGNEYLEYQKKIMSRGRLLSVSQGNYIGSVPPYGYNKIWVTEDKKKYPTLEENKEQADIVRLIFDLYVNANMGVHVISKHLDSLGIQPPKGVYWSPHALKEMLRNVHYIGKVKWNWRKTVTVVEDSEIIKTRPKSKTGDFLIYDGKHPAIISEELFTAAQEKIGKNHKAKPTTKVRNPLASIVYCSCGRAMSMRTYKKDGVERAPARLVCDGQVNCGVGSCLYDEMLGYVREALKSTIKDFEIKANGTSNDALKLHEKHIKSLEKKLDDIHQQEINMWKASVDPNPEKKIPADIFKILKEDLAKEKEETQQALTYAQETMPKPIEYKNKILMFQNALNALDDENTSAEDKNRLLKACIDRINYHREKPQRVRRQADEKKGETLTAGGNWTSPPIEVDIKIKA